MWYKHYSRQKICRQIILKKANSQILLKWTPALWKLYLKYWRTLKNPSIIHSQNLCTEVTISLGLCSEINNLSTSSENLMNTEKQSFSHVALQQWGRIDTDIRKQEVPTSITTKINKTHTEFTLNTSMNLNVLKIYPIFIVTGKNSFQSLFLLWGFLNNKISHLCQQRLGQPKYKPSNL